MGNDVEKFYEEFAGSEESLPANTPWGLWYQEYPEGLNVHLACRCDHAPVDVDLGLFTHDGLIIKAREIDLTTANDNMPEPVVTILAKWNETLLAVKWFQTKATDAERQHFSERIKTMITTVKQMMIDGGQRL